MAGSETEKEITKSDPSQDPIIPGLPDDIAEQCLLHLPFPYHALARSVSPAWSSAVSSAARRRSLSPSSSLPYLSVFAFHRPSLRLRCLAFDPISFRWLPLPPIPLPFPLLPSSFAAASLPRSGNLFLIGGMRADTYSPIPTVLSFNASTNAWISAASMPTPRAFFSAATVGDQLVVAGGDLNSVDRYDPHMDRWTEISPMRRSIERYDAAVLGRRLYITGGWKWPFEDPPRGGQYDVDDDTWQEMKAGMRTGWTGVSVVVDDKLFVVSECGAGRVKAYDEKEDTWRAVGGEGVPLLLEKPYAACGVTGTVYVIGNGLSVGVGRVGGNGSDLNIEWELVKGSDKFADLAPVSCQLIYA
ncbi:F-box domain-containing protein [Dioscorea alata]|uniref:F-box domain-containing protein n=1 Tax=Dioscorea alata TaxID=55571 RepID=A0ACB7VDE4_DIOAL|nr:F-box domain-containing protein [Dioscorea alata]